MASPFTVFRKHQKILIATLGLAAMIAFVFLGTIQQQMGGRTAKDPVVVSTTKYGDITEHRLHNMRQQRRQLFNVLRQATILAGGEPMQVQMRLEFLQQMFGAADEESTVNTWLIVQHAKQLGMRIDDKAVNDVLKILTENRMTGEQLNQLFKRMGISEKRFFDLMSEELLALNARQMFATSLRGIPPAQRWDYYQRLYRKVTIEVAPVRVADYVDQVAEADEDTLQTFFDKYKRRYADPASPEPGFRVPRKIAIEYFKAEYDKFTDAESVTDEEIEAYYQENRDRDYRKVELPGLDDDEPMETEPTETEPTETEPTETEPTEKEPAAETPAEKPAEKPAEVPAEKPVEETLQQQTHGVQPVGFDENIAPDDENIAPDEEEKAPEKQGDEEPDKSETPDKIEYKPLEEVKGEIRQILARKKARERIMDRLGVLRSKMKKYRSSWIVFKAREKGSTEQPPVKLDMAGLAKKNNLALYATTLISEREAYGLDIGKSYIDGRQPFMDHAFETLPEYRPASSQDVDGNFYLFWKTNFVDERMPELDDDDELIRQEVLQSWKSVQARDLALKEARRLADVAREAGKKSLAEALAAEPGVEVRKTEPFTWMTLGAAAITYRTPPKLSQVEHVEAAGHDFMRAVYDLDVDRLGVTMNQPQTVAYVVRVVSTEPDQRVLWRMFRADDFSKYAAVAQEDINQLIEAWRKQLERDAGLTWQRPPDQHAPRRR